MKHLIENLRAYFVNKRLLKFLIIFFIFLAAIIYINSYKFISFETRFASAVNTCNKVTKQLRFSCYREVLEKYQEKPLSTYMASIENNDKISFKSEDSSYAVFGTDCHTFYHAVGDFIATNATEKDLPSQIKYCSASCTSGCIMGLYKRVALQNHFDTATLEQYYIDCPENSKHQCAHEIGHNLHDKYTVSILQILDNLTQKNYGLKTDSAYQYVTYKEPNLDAPFDECKSIVPESELPYCYTGIGHNLFLFSEFNPAGYKTTFDECEKTDNENRENCYDFLIYRIGINEAAPLFLSKHFEEGEKMCDDVIALAKRPKLKSRCYLGIGGGIGLFIDSEYIHTKVTDENLSELQSAVLDEINLCGKIKSDFNLDCYRGILGTGAKKLYKQLNLVQPIIEDILPKIDNGFQVVG